MFEDWTLLKSIFMTQTSKYLLFVFFLCMRITDVSASKLLITEEVEVLELFPYLEIYEDENSMTFEEIRQNEGVFRAFEEDDRGRTSRKPNWLRFEVEQQVEDTLNLLLRIMDSDYTDVWILSDTLIKLRTGNLVKREERSYQSTIDHVRLDFLKNKNYQIYYRVERVNGVVRFRYPPCLMTESYEREGRIEKYFKRRKYSLLYTAFFGAIFIIMILVLAQKIQYGEQFSWYYLFYISAIFFYFFRGFSSSTQFDFLLGPLWQWREHLHAPTTYTIYLFFTLFLIDFLELKRPQKMHYLLRGVIVYISFCFLLFLIIWSLSDYHYAYAFFRATRWGLAILSCIVLVFSFRVQHPLRNYVIVSLLFVVIMGTVAIGLRPINQKYRLLGQDIPNYLYSLNYFRLGFLGDIVCFYLGLNKKYQLAQEAKKEALQQLNETELKALKAQMNPHFISNCVTSLKALIAKGQQKEAIFYTDKFAQLMRMSLALSDEKSISLEEELEFCELYLILEKLRFPQVEYAFHLDPKIDTSFIQIPPMILQIFLENALQHGLKHQTKGKKTIELSVTYEKENIVCRIIDNGIGRKKSQKLNGNRRSFGTRLTQQKIEVFNKIYDAKIDFSINDCLDKKNEVMGTEVLIYLEQKKPTNAQNYFD